MQENTMPTYHVGNSSPLRTQSPKRGTSESNTYIGNQQQQHSHTTQQHSATFNVTQVNKASAHAGGQTTMVSHSTVTYGAGGNCAGAPTEKERMIAQLMKEAADLRQRERDYKQLQDSLMNMEQNFGRLNEEKRRMDEDYKSRVDANIRFIQTLRSEVDEQRTIYNDRKRQNAELNTELDRQRALISDRNVDIQRVKHEQQVSEDTNASLQSQKRQTDDELAALRDRNREDLEEIDRLNVANEVKANEGNDLSGHIRNLEFEISKALNQVEELNRLIDQKTFDLKGKEQQLAECDREITSLKNQMSNFMNELNHLKSLEQRYKDENGDLQRRIDQEGCQNVELSSAIKELEVKIRQKEDQLLYMRKELEGARYSNSALLENNANLQVEIDSMNNHIRVVSHQNDELTREIDQFVQANEVIRQRLDRKNRVMELREKNDYNLQQSMANVHHSKSPVRHY